MQQIILKNLERPKDVDILHDIEWLSDSFGFSAGRDTEKVSSKVVHTVLKEVADEGAASSEHIAHDLSMNVQRINYHLRSLVNSGFLYREKRMIFLRQGSVKAAVEEMRQDANRIFDSLSHMAEDIDKSLGLRYR